MVYNRTNLKIWGLRAKSWATVMILSELILIVSVVGFAYKQHIRVAQAEGVYTTIENNRVKLLIKDPTPEQQQIINYIRERFGENANDAIRVFNCESHLRPNAVNTNWSSVRGVVSSYDYGVAQINSVHRVDSRFLLDWHTNIDVAYKIFSEQGFTPWTCKYVLN